MMPPAWAMSGLTSRDWSMSPASRAKLTEGHHDVHQSTNVERGLATTAEEERSAPQGLEHLHGRVLVDRRESQRRVTQHLGPYPAQTHHHHGPEGRVPLDAGNQLGARRCHLGDDGTLDRGPRVGDPSPGHHGVDRVGHAAGIADTENHAPEVRSVGDLEAATFTTYGARKAAVATEA